MSARTRKPRRVLIVDDHAANRKLLGVIITEMGWAFHAVESGADAVQACATEGPFDLILMDYHMPGMDGAESTAAIRSHGGWAESTPVIGITADDSQLARARCLSAGMITCLSKPIQPLAVAALMRRAVDRDHVQPELRRVAAG